MDPSAYLPPATAAQAAAVHALVHVTPRMLAYEKAQIFAALLSPVLDIGLILLILRLGWASRTGAWADRLSRFTVLSGAALWISLHAMIALVLFPLTWWADYRLPHQYGLSVQAPGAWLGDTAKAYAVDWLIGGLIAGAALALIRRAPKRWPLIAAAAMVPVLAFSIFAAPLAIDPLFNKFHVMPQSDPLRPRLEALAREAGIAHAQIYIVDKSRQTKETNAYVTGLGSSARIVLWDTTIAKMPPEQVAAVTAHEMGHYVEHHVAFGFVATCIALFALFPLTAWISARLLQRWGAAWRLDSLAQAGSLAVLLLVVDGLAIVTWPIDAAASRVIEHRADAFGLALTGDRVTFAKAFVALSSDNLASPYPPRWVALLSDHPPLGERIDFALTGQPRDLWPRPGLPIKNNHSGGKILP